MGGEMGYEEKVAWLLDIMVVLERVLGPMVWSPTKQAWARFANDQTSDKEDDQGRPEDDPVIRFEV